MHKRIIDRFLLVLFFIVGCGILIIGGLTLIGMFFAGFGLIGEGYYLYGILTWIVLIFSCCTIVEMGEKYL